MIIIADALEVYKELAEYSTVQIVDPPYSEHTHANGKSNRPTGPEDRDLGFAPLDERLRDAIADAASTVQGWTIVHSDFEGAEEWRLSMRRHGLEYIRTVPWVRFTMPQISGDRPCAGAEAILHFHQKLAKTWYGPGSHTHYCNTRVHGAQKVAGEKPLDLALSLVSYSTSVDDCVLDLCCGRGTTARACQILGRSFLCVEQDESKAALAEERLKVSLKDSDDFGRASSWGVLTRDEARQTIADLSTSAFARAKAEHRLEDAERVLNAVGFKK